VPGGQRDRFLQPYYRISRTEELLFHSSGSSIVLTKLSGPSSRPTTSEEIWYAVTSGCVARTRPQRQSIFFYITYINSVRTSEETQYICVL
jgi:hypothetical protein